MLKKRHIECINYNNHHFINGAFIANTICFSHGVEAQYTAPFPNNAQHLY